MSSSSMPDSHAGKSTVSPNRAWIFSDSDASSMLSISRSVLNFVSAVIGLSRTSGFVDDTRAFCSIPARHDMARRLEAGFLADLVADHRLDLAEARDLAADLVVGQPSRVFKLAGR